MLNRTMQERDAQYLALQQENVDLQKESMARLSGLQQKYETETSNQNQQINSLKEKLATKQKQITSLQDKMAEMKVVKETRDDFTEKVKERVSMIGPFLAYGIGSGLYLSMIHKRA